jgi:hypothetical protein
VVYLLCVTRGVSIMRERGGALGWQRSSLKICSHHPKCHHRCLKVPAQLPIRSLSSLRVLLVHCCQRSLFAACTAAAASGPWSMSLVAAAFRASSVLVLRLGDRNRKWQTPAHGANNKWRLQQVAWCEAMCTLICYLCYTNLLRTCTNSCALLYCCSCR